MASSNPADILRPSLLYLVPKTLEKLIPKFRKELKKGTKIVSYRYPCKRNHSTACLIDSRKGLNCMSSSCLAFSFEKNRFIRVNFAIGIVAIGFVPVNLENSVARKAKKKTIVDGI